MSSLFPTNTRYAIASASPHKFIDEVLNELHLTDTFDTTVSAQEVAHGKPAPDVFLLAAKRLGVAPRDSVVIEDGRSGMIGACATDMKVVGLVSDISADYPATLLVTSLSELSAKKLRELDYYAAKPCKK